MTFINSLLVSIYGLGIVFAVLIILCGVVILQSKLFNIMFQKKATPDEANNEQAASMDSDTIAGELELVDVDERTAAMIMAIVSDESKIPLSELQFKSIKAIN